MKQLDIDETTTSFVIKVRGSTLGRIVPKDDPQAMHAMLLEALAEAPEASEEEHEPQPEQSTLGQAAGALDGEEMGVEEAARTILNAAKDVLDSPEAKQVKSFFERLPKSKRHQQSG
jgi:hypothetical protein